MAKDPWSVVCLLIFSDHVFEVTGSVEAKLHMLHRKPPYVGGKRVYLWDVGHVTRRLPCPYVVKTL